MTVPLAVNVNAFAPLIAPEKLKAEPLAMTGPVKATGPVIEIGLAVVVRLPPKLISVEPV